jgi:hypothetical protein
MSRFKGRPMDGLPGRLPAGEAVLWQGAPDWRSLAVHAFRMKWIAGYFGLLVAVRFGGAVVTGHGLGFALSSAVSGLIFSAVATGMFLALAWLIARTTTYTITSKRVVITYGMALPKSLNLPFAAITGAQLGVHEDGTGDILIQVPPKPKLAFLLLWPHVQAGKHGVVSPVLRCIAKPEEVAALLKTAAQPVVVGAEALELAVAA